MIKPLCYLETYFAQGSFLGHGGSTTTHGPHTYEHGSLVYVLDFVTVVYAVGQADELCALPTVIPALNPTLAFKTVTPPSTPISVTSACNIPASAIVEIAILVKSFILFSFLKSCHYGQIVYLHSRLFIYVQDKFRKELLK